MANVLATTQPTPPLVRLNGINKIEGDIMLKGIPPILGPDLLHALRAMGHGDEIAIVDANFPGDSAGPPVDPPRWPQPPPTCSMPC